MDPLYKLNFFQGQYSSGILFFKKGLIYILMVNFFHRLIILYTVH